MDPGTHDHASGPDAAVPPRNRLLAALPAAEWASLKRHLRRAALGQGEVLYGPAAPVHTVYFPETAVASVLMVLGRDTDRAAAAGGPAVEVGTVGCEGLVGLGVFLSGDGGATADDASAAGRSPIEGADAPGVRAVAQVAGDAWCLSADAFAALAAVPGPLHRLLLRYTQAYLAQVAQTAACNAAHGVEARCARWLLMTQDRTAGDDLPLKHAFLAAMLGVREEGVATALAALASRGVIEATRDAVTVVDRAGLEGAACACYDAVRAEYTRLLGPAGGLPASPPGGCAAP